MDIRLDYPPERKIPDPMDWARGPRVYCDQARLLAPAMGLNASMLISGEVLYRVLGDDANIFTGFDWPGFNPETARKKFEERLDWEINTPETDQQIKEELEKFRQSIVSFDWSDLQQRSQISSARKEFCGQINQIVSQRPDLAAAKDYAEEHRGTVKAKIVLLSSPTK